MRKLKKKSKNKRKLKIAGNSGWDLAETRVSTLPEPTPLTPEDIEASMGMPGPPPVDIERLVDSRVEHFFSGKCLKDGLKDEFRKEMQTVAYSLRAFFKEETEKMAEQLKIDFMRELRNL